MDNKFFKFLETYWSDIEAFVNAFIGFIKAMFASNEGEEA